MSQEILSVKLRQLDGHIARLHAKVRMSEASSHARLRPQVEALERECAEAEAALRQNMLNSRSSLVAVLAQAYEQVEQVILSARGRVQALAQANPDEGCALEEKILLAEYALDFAHQAADRALLLSMDAIDAQLAQQEEGRTT